MPKRVQTESQNGRRLVEEHMNTELGKAWYGTVWYSIEGRGLVGLLFRKM